jgi:hypothetical protein
MKKYILILMTGIGFLASCTEEAIDILPKDAIASEEVFSTAARCELAIVGCYDAAQSGYNTANDAKRGYPFGAASIEQADMKGEDMINVQSFFAYTYEGTYGVTSANGQSHWETTFAMINKINGVIEGLQSAEKDGILSSAKAADGEAEIRFLRALGLHEMLIFYSMPYKATADASHYGAPVSLEPINSISKVEEAKKAGRKTVKETYDQILADLNFAEANLEATRSGTLKISRATKGAAIAMKARVYQHLGQWDKVIEESKKIVSGSAPFKSPVGAYELTAKPDGVFANNSSNTESIFSIENDAQDNPGTNGCLFQMYYGRSLVCISPIIINADFWKADDLRRSLLTERKNKYGSKNAYWSLKYRSDPDWADWAPIIRYAEVLLNYAEAEARSSATVSATAVDLLNAVRNRAVTDAADQFTVVSFADADALVAAILQERRIEFLAEGRRWPDIHRLTFDPKFAVLAPNGTAGVPNKVAWGNVTDDSYDPASGNLDPNILKIIGFDYNDRRFIFPIPEQETSANEVLAKQQNAGWN